MLPDGGYSWVQWAIAVAERSFWAASCAMSLSEPEGGGGVRMNAQDVQRIGVDEMWRRLVEPCTVRTVVSVDLPWHDELQTTHKLFVCSRRCCAPREHKTTKRDAEKRASVRRRAAAAISRTRVPGCREEVPPFRSHPPARRETHVPHRCALLAS